MAQVPENDGKVKKHDLGNSDNKIKTDNKGTKKMISAEVVIALSQLAGSDNKSDGYESNNPDQVSSPMPIIRCASVVS